MPSVGRRGNMKYSVRQLVSLMTVVGLTAGALYYYLVAPFVEIHQRRERYKLITRDMSKHDVVAIMGEPDTSGEPGAGPFWDDELLNGVSLDDVEHAIRYNTSTFYLGVIFEFTFDDEGRIIGKHCYD